MEPRTDPLEQLDALWDFDDPAESERRFQVILPRARTEHDGHYLAETLTQIARAQGLQRHFDDARSTLAEAERVLRPEDGRGRIRLLLERSRVERFEGHEGPGRTAFLAAWELARQIGEDGLAVDAAHMLGLVEPADGAWRWNERAMELARSSEAPAARRWLGSLANNMGWARHEAGDHSGAIALFELSRDAFLADGRVDRARIARWSIAVPTCAGDVEAALAEQGALLAELEASQTRRLRLRGDRRVSSRARPRGRGPTALRPRVRRAVGRHPTRGEPPRAARATPGARRRLSLSQEPREKVRRLTPRPLAPAACVESTQSFCARDPHGRRVPARRRASVS